MGFEDCDLRIIEREIIAYLFGNFLKGIFLTYNIRAYFCQNAAKIMLAFANEIGKQKIEPMQMDFYGFCWLVTCQLNQFSEKTLTSCEIEKKSTRTRTRT